MHDLTDKKKKFVDAVLTHKGSLTAAARIAGYTDPKGEVDRLLADPKVFTALMRRIQPKMVKLEKLVAMAYDALYYNLDPENWDRVGADGKGSRVSSSDRNTAVRVLFDAIARIDPKLLQQKAREADEAQDAAEAAASILGESTEGEA